MRPVGNRFTIRRVRMVAAREERARAERTHRTQGSYLPRLIDLRERERLAREELSSQAA